MKPSNYEADTAAFPADAYSVEGHRGVAWRVYGWELVDVVEPDFYNEETDTLIVGTELREQRTGRIVCVMVGDDRRFTFEPDALTPLNDEDYCGGCGQVGCTWG